MPTRTGPEYPSNWNGWPEAMSTEDYAIWQRWKAKGMLGIRKLHFNVGLGPGTPAVGANTPKEAEGWRFLTQKRADVIAVHEVHIEIIELRFQAGANALGRLRMYMMLYMTDPVLGEHVTLRLVTDHIDADARKMAEIDGIEVDVV